jgi:hypothetical protein
MSSDASNPLLAPGPPAASQLARASRGGAALPHASGGGGGGDETLSRRGDAAALFSPAPSYSYSYCLCSSTTHSSKRVCLCSLARRRRRPVAVPAVRVPALVHLVRAHQGHARVSILLRVSRVRASSLKRLALERGLSSLASFPLVRLVRGVVVGVVVSVGGEVVLPRRRRQLQPLQQRRAELLDARLGAVGDDDPVHPAGQNLRDVDGVRAYDLFRHYW